MTLNNLAIPAESASHSLGKAQRISPHLPDAAFQTHLPVDSSTPLISMEHGTPFNSIIMTYHTESVRRTAAFPIKMQYQKTALSQLLA